MSTVVPAKGHRHTRSAVMPPPATASQNPQNPHHLNSQAYAMNSQSDINYSPHPTTPPRTPRKEIQPASQTKTHQETGSKQKPRNKRPKNVMTSPAVIKGDRNTPPLTGAQSAGMPSSAKPISTPSTAAYAGPTFHASPAPSTLPIPSFYSKSVPDSPGIKGLKSLREASLSESPTPAHNSISNTALQREESPLDVFFKADREEKARARSASSTKTALSSAGPFQPPAGSPRTSQTPPAPGSHNRPRHLNKNSPNVMFAMELDGDSAAGKPYGPAFSTPYSERISAARSSGSQEEPRVAQSTMNSEALKAYLFSGHQNHSTPTSDKASASVATTSHQSISAPGGGPRNTNTSSRSRNNNSFAPEIASNHGPRMSGRSSGLRQEVSPSRTPSKTPDRSGSYTNSPTPSRMYGNSTSSNTNEVISTSTPHTGSPAPNPSYDVSSVNKSVDIKGMEDSLRKILKLDSNSEVKVPAATASVPNYVGGRPPPLNGIHNGVMGS